MVVKSKHGVRCFCAPVAALAAVLAVGGFTASADAAGVLEAYWPLNETSGTMTMDLSGNGLDGTLQTGATLSAAGAPGFMSGAAFDGVDDQILIGPGNTTGLGNLTSDFTVMGWINPADLLGVQRIMGASPSAAWGFGINGSNLRFTTFGVKDYEIPGPVLGNAWSHIAAVMDASFDTTFYLDGNLLGTILHTASGNTTANNFFLGTADGAAEHFNGSLDELAIFSGALTQEQVQNAKNFGALNFNGLPVPEPATAALGLLAVGALGLVARRRQA